jgi:recombination protein RecA
MAKRDKLSPTENNYFTSDKKSLKFVSSGCSVLDCALGGGYPLGRIVNLVGDRSTAKTALATEAIINFLRAYEGRAAYRETEAAFDQGYAEAMGLPLDEVDFGDPDKPLTTIEEFDRDLQSFLEDQAKAQKPGIYILDSLDALSDEGEMSRDIGEGTYGAAKAKGLSQIFRKRTREIDATKTLVIVVSQLRDNIGAMFGEKHKRSGGRALDFYASQIVWLHHIGILKRVVKKVERPYGIELRAKVKKNKVGLSLREAEMEFRFGFGIEDLLASVTWLKDVNRLEEMGLDVIKVKEYLSKTEALTNGDYEAERQKAAEAVKRAWAEIETSFLPTRKKYG